MFILFCLVRNLKTRQTANQKNLENKKSKTLESEVIDSNKDRTN